MSKKTHWKKLHNPNYLGAYSLDNGKGGYSDIVAKISKIRNESVVGGDGKKEDCTVAYLQGQKPMILNATNLKTLESVLKTPYLEDWAGREIQIGVEKVKAFGETVDALRIRKFLPKPKAAPKCADTGKEIKATDKMTAEQIIAVTQKRYGRPLCAERWVELVKEEKSNASGTGTGKDNGAGADASETETDKQ